MTRDQLEKALARRFGRELTAQEKEIVALAETDPDRLLHESYWEEEKQRYPWLRRLLAAGAIAAAVEALPAGARGRIAPPIPSGAATIEETVIGLAENWAKEYSFNLIKGITDTTRDAVAQALDEYRLGVIDYDQFVARLAPKFGPGRAATIARTEAARAGNMGALETGQYLAAQGYEPHYIYMYSQSEAPCPSRPLCSELDGKEIEQYGPDWPPRHYNCQCGVNVVFDVPAKTYVTPEQLEQELEKLRGEFGQG